ncbi:MAG: hypothetical protein PT934_01555 [Peptoniphilaceae bacterium]|uniref:hypothetical protein n=1 Tax=Bacteria TaxID=2 RepID=UPI002A74D140|nr:hypothetical protein [Parvimonas sp.]MDD7764434.1 hypothetical protein [Peptoniphilaceae bacterium]MDY3051282.1 hypothetical protein [Parvimonas sp.]MDY5795628.1 hypothetical protein [Fusobacterium gastrosuis]
MFFRNYKFNVTFFRKKFELGEICTHYGLQSFIVKSKYELPWTGSSICKNKNISVRKLLSENFERLALGYNIESEKEIKLLSFNADNIISVKGKEVAYGSNYVFGSIDTTGTASGVFKSDDIINKAVFELLEKNELLLLWYGLLAEEYKLSYEEHKKFMKYFNNLYFLTDEIRIFFNRNLSNGFCLFVFLFKDKKLVGAGCSFNLVFKKALSYAIQEAYNLTIIYRDKSFGHYKHLTDEEHGEIYNHLDKISLSKYKINNFYEGRSLEIKNSLDDIYICFLNRCRFSYGKTIKVYSKKMYTCLPSRYNFKRCEEKEILKKFKIDINDKEIPDCYII